MPSLSVCTATDAPPALVAASLARLRPLASQVVVAVDSKVPIAELGPYESVADEVVRFEWAGPPERPLSWLHSLCDGDRIFRIDGDEVASDALLAALPGAVSRADVLQVSFFRAWLHGDARTWIEELPWWPDPQLRLVRNDPAVTWFPGRMHTSAAEVAPAAFYEAPLWHLDFLLKDEAARRAKAAGYDSYAPGLQASGGGDMNPTLYLPEERGQSLRTAGVPEGDAAVLEEVLSAARRPPSRWSGAEPRLYVREEVDELWEGRTWRDDEIGARLEVVDRDVGFSTGQVRPLTVRVANTGAAPLRAGAEREPRIHLTYRWWTGTGDLVVSEGLRTTLPCTIAAGATEVVPMTVAAPPGPGQHVLEVAVVHRGRRLPETLRSPVLVAEGRPGDPSPARWRSTLPPR